MKIPKLIGWGIVIYALVSLVWSGLLIHGLSDMLLARIAVLVTLIATTAVATRALNLYNARDVLPYAFGWMLIAAGLDAVYVVPYVGWQLYSDWNMWVGYGLVLMVPLVTTFVMAASKSSAPAS